MRRLLPCVAAALSCARAAPAPRTCAAQPTAAAVEKVGIHGDRALLPAQVAYRSYGEFVGIGGDLGQHIVTGFVDNPLDYLARPDTAKIKVFLDALAAGKLDPFTFITLQYDHTFGLLPGKPSPETMVADNDRATGLLVEAVSRSPFWQDTLILITEDDPAGSADHVDAHRSFALVVSQIGRAHV